MGDFYTLTITVRKCDEKATAKALLLGVDYEDCIEAAEPSTEHLSTFVDRQAYYAMEDERRALAAAGIPFYGSHGPGDFDPGYAFAACDGTMLEVPMIGNREDLGVPCDWDTGLPDPIRLARVRDYITLRKRVEALFATNSPRYFLELTADQLEIFGFAIKAKLDTLATLDDVISDHWRQRLNEAYTLLDTAPTNRSDYDKETRS